MNFFRFVAPLSLFLISLLSGQTNPKNIIYLIGDGMGVNYLGATFLDDANNPLRQFNSIGLANTASQDKLITDSGAAATVLATGYRTKNGYISVDSDRKPLSTIIEVAKYKGKSTGIISTSSVTHATPAAFYAHVDDRGRETDIAAQLAYADIDLIIGGGYQFFIPDLLGGSRKDEIDYIKLMKSAGYKWIEEFDFDLVVNSEKLICLMEKNGLKRASERKFSLGDFTKAALEKLSKDPDGFVLIIEGSQIDWAGHENQPDYLLSEMRDFNTAITSAFQFAQKEGETLIIITADHETGGMSIIGGDLNGKNLKIEFTGKGHTAGFVPVLSYGPQSQMFQGILENYEIGQNLILLIDPDLTF